MTTTTTEQLLDELVGRWTRGEPLAVEELLTRAGPGADELATLIDAFLERAPRREPTPEALELVHSLDAPPLLRARQARRLKLDDLVAGLVETLALPQEARAKVRRYYQQLELGQLDPAGVAAAVWVALAGLLGRDARGLVGAEGLMPAPSAPAMYRASDVGSAFVEQRAMPSRAESERFRKPERDQVDRLFGVTTD